MIDQEKLEELIRALGPKVEVCVVSYDDMTRLAEIWRDALQRTRAEEETKGANDDAANDD